MITHFLKPVPGRGPKYRTAASRVRSTDYCVAKMPNIRLNEKKWPYVSYKNT